MAVTVRRAALITVAGCALIAAAYLPPEAGPDRESYGPPWWSRSSMELRAAENGLVVLEYRDSLVATMQANPGDPLVVSLFAHGVLPDSAAAAIRRQVEALVPAASQGGVRTGLALIVRPARGGLASDEPPPYVIGEETINYLPTSGSGLCLTVATVTLHPRVRPPAALAAVLRTVRQDLIGPCWFLREFGPPGPGTAAWLAGGGAWYAAAFSRTRPRSPRRERPSWLRVALGIEDRPFGPEFVWQPYGDRSLAEVSCLNGRTDRCRTLIADPAAADPDPWFAFWQTDVPGVVSLPLDTRTRSDKGWLLADLLAAQGRERFIRFWQSTLTFDSAFTDAFGEAPGGWMKRWAQASLGPAPYPPWPGVGDAMITVAAVAVLVIVGSALRDLRQIG
jgi:hypothetical protein